VSKNKITIDQLLVACHHVEELREARVTENLAIRTLELFADVYAKLRVMGNANPNRASEVKLWSKAALDLKKARPNARANECFRVEHGTPRRAFARMVMDRYRDGALTEDDARTREEVLEASCYHAGRGREARPLPLLCIPGGAVG
jgi:hypothetical protein